MTEAARMNREDRLERTMSMAHNKGLLNLPGENNCFLNSAVQVLWHLDVFRRSFREIQGHFCLGRSCIFCALKTIFEEFQYGTDTALPPDALRIALAHTFKDQMRFQMGDMDDAAECFENILGRIHFHTSMNDNLDGCDAKHCISHQKFAMQIIEQTICECGEMSEPLPFFQLVHYVSASALCSYSHSLPDEYKGDRDIDVFGKLLRNAGEDIRECSAIYQHLTSPYVTQSDQYQKSLQGNNYYFLEPKYKAKECKNKVQVQRLLLNSPDIVSVGLIWDSDSPEIEHISEVLQCIGTTLILQDLFHQVYDKKARYATLRLVGIVTYYGKHYSTFFFHNRLRTWIYFDDARVKEIGPDWSEIIRKCRRCHYQPLLLLYANPQGTPVDTRTAPTKVQLVNGATPCHRVQQKKRPAPICEENVREIENESFHESQTSSSPKSRGISPKTKKSVNASQEKQFSRSNLYRARSNELLERYPGETSVELKRCHSTDVLTNSKTSLRVNSQELLNGNVRDLGLKSTNSRGFLEIPSSRDTRTHSSDLLDSPTSDRYSSRASSVGSDSASAGGKSADECHSPGKETGPRKEKAKRKSLKKIGSALKHAINPMNLNKKRSGSKETGKKRRHSEGSNEKDLINLNVQADPAKEAIMALYEQSKAHHFNRFPSTSNDSGISSTPSSATSSVSSTDTTHGGSDEDLIDLSQNSSLHSRSKDNNARELLRKGDESLQRCQQFQRQQEYESALCCCTTANSFYRIVSEMRNATPDEILYARRRRDESLNMARALRQGVHTRPEQTGPNTASFRLENEEELLQNQQRRDQLILQEYQRSGQPAQLSAVQRHGHATLPRKLPSSTVRSLSHSLGVIKERTPSPEPELHQVRPTDAYHSSGETSQYGTFSSKARVYNVRSHYSKNHPPVSTSSLEGVNVCSQQIKPEAMCYSPVHYDRSNRDSELVNKMESVSIRPTMQTARVYSVKDDRSSTSAPTSNQWQNANRTNQVATKTIYVSAPKQAPPSAAQPLENRRYTNSNYCQREPPAQRYQADKRGSYYDNVDYADDSNLSSYGQRLPTYREPPSYQRHQTRDTNQQYRDANERLRDTSSKMMSYQRGPNLSRPWNSSYPDQSSGYLRGNSDDLQQISAQISSERQKCARCHGVPVERGRSYCAACETTTRLEDDRQNARLY